MLFPFLFRFKKSSFFPYFLLCGVFVSVYLYIDIQNLLLNQEDFNIFIPLQTPVKPLGIFPNNRLQSHLSAIDPMKNKPHGPEVPVGECQ